MFEPVSVKRFMFVIACFASLSACSVAKPVSRLLDAVGIDSAPPNELAERRPFTVGLQVFAGRNLNAGTEPQALALVVRIIELSDVGRFRSARFSDFLSEADVRKVLGDDLIASRELVLLPGQAYTQALELAGDTRTVAMIALFRSPAEERWRALFDARKSAQGGIRVGVHACAMSVGAGVLLSPWSGSPESLSTVHCPLLPK